MDKKKRRILKVLILLFISFASAAIARQLNTEFVYRLLIYFVGAVLAGISAYLIEKKYDL